MILRASVRYGAKLITIEFKRGACIPVAIVFYMLGLLASANTLAAEERLTIDVWPEGVTEDAERIGAETSTVAKEPPITLVTNVTRPTLTVYQPPPEQSNGCAVLICPGGGYYKLAIDLEGTEVAEWFNTLGVTAAVLKYRVPRRDEEHPHKIPLQDAQRAIRLMRQHARAWGIDPDRVGVLGFSAGGNLALMMGTRWEQHAYEKSTAVDQFSCRPVFMILIYAAYLGDKQNDKQLSPNIRVSNTTPPTFMAVTYDDQMRGLHAALLLAELKKAGVPAELHVYSKGGHGYGLRASDNPVCHWPDRCADWMRASSLLKR